MSGKLPAVAIMEAILPPSMCSASSSSSPANNPDMAAAFVEALIQIAKEPPAKRRRTANGVEIFDIVPPSEQKWMLDGTAALSLNLRLLNTDAKRFEPGPALDEALNIPKCNFDRSVKALLDNTREGVKTAIDAGGVEFFIPVRHPVVKQVKRMIAKHKQLKFVRTEQSGTRDDETLIVVKHV